MSEVKSNRAWRLECEELRSRLAETLRSSIRGDIEAAYNGLDYLTSIHVATAADPNGGRQLAIDAAEIKGRLLQHMKRIDAALGIVTHGDSISGSVNPDQPPTVLTNPWNGEPRDIRDVESDPTGILMVEPGKPLRAADQPNDATERTGIEFLHLWMRTPNPMLGNVSPLDMMDSGRGERLADFIRDAAEANGIAEVQK